MARSTCMRVNFMLPRELYYELRLLIPERKRSQVIAALIKEEIARREEKLYRQAKALEQDKALNQEMKEWDSTLEDGLKGSEWK